MAKIIKTEVTTCVRCPNGHWSIEDGWQLKCTLLNKIIIKKGREYPIPEDCPLDNVDIN